MMTSCDMYAGCDDVTPGSSFVFSCLEVCLSIIVRHIPAINSNLVTSSVYQTSSLKYTNQQEMTQAVCAVLNVIEQLPSLCSQNGSFSKSISRLRIVSILKHNL